MVWNKGTKGICKPNSGSFKKGSSGFNRKHTIETRKKMSESFKNRIKDITKHPRYIKDRTKLVVNEKKHLDTNYKNWMLNVKSRDSWKCKISNKDCNGRLEAHHILNWVEYPELRYEINNGITLCHAHHPRKRAEEKRLSPYFMELVSVSKEKNWNIN